MQSSYCELFTRASKKQWLTNTVQLLDKCYGTAAAVSVISVLLGHLRKHACRIDYSV